MKRYIMYLFTSLVILNSCKEEYIGQYPVDKVAPGVVTNISVENIPGGAILSYTLPPEKDLLCIKARYTLSNGVKMEQSGSAYVNKITLKGFGKSAKTTVEVVAIDKSHNESPVVRVGIEPLDSPIYTILKSFGYQESFGGLKLTWENNLREEIVLDVLMKDQAGDFIQLESFYSSSDNVATAVRGLDPEAAEFGFYFRDTYNNHTDTIYDTLTPLFEKELDKSKFRAFPLASVLLLYDASYVMTRLWDGNYGTAYQFQTFYIRVGEVDPFFSFDMGVVAKLSRFKLWQRSDHLFSLHNPRYFEIWGTNDASKTADPDNWEGWFKVGDFESKRPSGLKPGEPLTTEDREYIMAGEEFEVPIEAPSFRYFRMYVRNPYNSALGGSWSGSRALHLEEMKIWGAPENE